MATTSEPTLPLSDQPFFDQTAYGNGPDDSITDVSESAAITHHTTALGGRTIPYTATAGHLVIVDPSSSKATAKIFYVAFTVGGVDPSTRPVTFFYNGGPGSSSVYLLLGSFAPMRLKTNLPDFTPPAPYALEPNPDSLLDRSDLVFINPVGTGYSAAIAPSKNRDFWGVDQDARSLKQFIKRYLTANHRWNSPKFLFGESYGTARSCVLGWMLHEDGIDLNGITLQSSILDYSKSGNPTGLLPTLAADAWYHKKISVKPPPADLPSFLKDVVAFAKGPYVAALAAFPKIDPAVLQTLSDDIGIPPAVLKGWSLNVAANNNIGLLFLVTLMQAEGRALGAYDGRALAVDTGIAASIDPNSGANDPTLTAVNGAYTVMWNTYLNDTLQYTSTSSFTDLNDQAFTFWDFGHIDPTKAQKGKDAAGNVILYTAGDLAATMALNPALKVLSANGYYDSVTPFEQTTLDLADMPLVDPTIRANLTVKYYPSGHMIYLDGDSRTAMKADLAAFYASTVAAHAARMRVLARQPKCVPYFKRRIRGLGARAASVGAGPWSVVDLCKAYDWPTNAPGGGVIAIVELDGGWVQSDMDAFFTAIDPASMPTITDVSVDGSRNNPNQHIGDPHDPDIEVAMDIQVAAAAYFVATGAPANIRVYWASNDLRSISAAVRRAASDGCDVCSISWGSDESNWRSLGQQLGQDLIQQLEASAQAATAAGMVVLAASGDNDSSDGGDNPTNVDVPSSCPHIIGCGGTTKTRSSEVVWNDSPGQTNGNGTGGGYSEYFPVQSFQAGAPNGPGRMVPDVAANADPSTGYNLVVHGGGEPLGGTSAVAPLYAGLFAAFGRKLGFVTPALWKSHLCFNDIPVGDNGSYRARVGPDPCTGLGTPIGEKIQAVVQPGATAAASPAEHALAAWIGAVAGPATAAMPAGAIAGKRRLIAGNVHRRPAAHKQLQPTDPQQIVTVTLIVRRAPGRPKPLAVGDFALARGARPKPLSRAAFSAAHGADPREIAQTVAVALANGLEVVEANPARRSVVVSGSVAAIDKSFAVQLHDYQAPDGKYHSHEGSASVPAALAGVVEAIIGLDNRMIPAKHYGRTPQRHGGRDPTDVKSLTPQQVAQLYDFPPGDGAGQTIGIYEMQTSDGSAGYTHDDVADTMRGFGGGLRVPTLVDVAVDGVGNSGQSDGETVLDITVASAIAQAATIAVYFTGGTAQSIIHALQRMIHPGAGDPQPSILSISYGWGPDDDDAGGLSSSAFAQIGKLFQDAAQLGITVLVSSGDSGALISDQARAQTSYPATEPWVLACGGTTIGNVNGGTFDEYVWNDVGAAGPGATGGGVSARFPPPSYQSGANVPKRVGTATPGRGIPDIAGNASENSGYPEVIGGQPPQPVGGTSAVAPLYAGLLARINANLGHPVGFINPILYTLPSSAFRDIVGSPGPADNSFEGVVGYPAGAGWDACTGFGSVRGTALQTGLQSAVVG